MGLPKSALHPNQFFGQTRMLQGDSHPVTRNHLEISETQKQQTPHEAGLHNRLRPGNSVLWTSTSFPHLRPAVKRKYRFR
jgi:hypothetical protein